MSIEQATERGPRFEKANYIIQAAMCRCLNLLSILEENKIPVEVHAQNGNIPALHRYYMTQAGRYPASMGKIVTVGKELYNFVNDDLRHKSETFGDFVLSADVGADAIIEQAADAEYSPEFQEALAGNTLGIHYPYGNFHYSKDDIADLAEYISRHMADDYPNVLMVSHEKMMRWPRRILGKAATFRPVEVHDAYKRAFMQAGYRAGLAVKDPDRVREFCDIPDAPMVAAIIPTSDALKVAERLSAPVRRSEDIAR